MKFIRQVPLFVGFCIEVPVTVFFSPLALVADSNKAICKFDDNFDDYSSGAKTSNLQILGQCCLLCPLNEGFLN